MWFKHILLLSCVLFLTMQETKAAGDFTYGEDVYSTNKVYMCLGVYSDPDAGKLPAYLFTVMMKSTKKPIAFPENSKLVVKFSNDSIIELNSFGNVIEEWETSYGVERSDDGIEYTGRNYDPYYRPWIYDSKPPMRIFYTGRNYELEDTDLQKLLMWRIVKVQVELTNGEKKDFKVGKRKGKKMLKKLQDSWHTL